MPRFKRICVFCGSSSGSRPAYTEAAEKLGRFLAEQRITLIYGGGRVGLMGTLANAVLAADGEVIGIIPHSLVLREVAHQGLTDLRVVQTMHERKALMAELSEAFVAMPGGFGTLDEFCEILTWAQLGLHRKPCGILNVCGYFDPLLRLLEHAVSEGFLRAEHNKMLIVEDDPATLLKKLSAYKAPHTEKWISNEDT
jgi:uncharacterized protein (TIGR00730 family)